MDEYWQVIFRKRLNKKIDNPLEIKVALLSYIDADQVGIGCPTTLNEFFEGLVKLFV